MIAFVWVVKLRVELEDFCASLLTALLMMMVGGVGGEGGGGGGGLGGDSSSSISMITISSSKILSSSDSESNMPLGIRVQLLHTQALLYEIL